MALSFEVTLTDKQAEKLTALQEAMGVADIGEVIRRAIEIAEVIHVFENKNYDIVARPKDTNAMPRRLEVVHHPRFEIKLPYTTRG